MRTHRTIGIALVEQVVRLSSNMLLEAHQNYGGLLTPERKDHLSAAIASLSKFRGASIEKDNEDLIRAHEIAVEQKIPKCGQHKQNYATCFCENEPKTKYRCDLCCIHGIGRPCESLKELAKK